MEICYQIGSVYGPKFIFCVSTGLENVINVGLFGWNQCWIRYFTSLTLSHKHNTYVAVTCVFLEDFSSSVLFPNVRLSFKAVTRMLVGCLCLWLYHQVINDWVLSCQNIRPNQRPGIYFVVQRRIKDVITAMPIAFHYIIHQPRLQQVLDVWECDACLWECVDYIRSAEFAAAAPCSSTEDWCSVFYSCLFALWGDFCTDKRGGFLNDADPHLTS